MDTLSKFLFFLKGGRPKPPVPLFGDYSDFGAGREAYDFGLPDDPIVDLTGPGAGEFQVHSGKVSPIGFLSQSSYTLTAETILGKKYLLTISVQRPASGTLTPAQRYPATIDELLLAATEQRYRGDRIRLRPEIFNPAEVDKLAALTLPTLLRPGGPVAPTHPYHANVRGMASIEVGRGDSRKYNQLPASAYNGFITFESYDPARPAEVRLIRFTSNRGTPYDHRWTNLRLQRLYPDVPGQTTPGYGGNPTRLTCATDYIQDSVSKKTEMVQWDNNWVHSTRLGNAVTGSSEQHSDIFQLGNYFENNAFSGTQAFAKDSLCVGNIYKGFSSDPHKHAYWSDQRKCHWSYNLLLDVQDPGDGHLDGSQAQYYRNTAAPGLSACKGLDAFPDGTEIETYAAIGNLCVRLGDPAIKTLTQPNALIFDAVNYYPKLQLSPYIADNVLVSNGSYLVSLTYAGPKTVIENNTALLDPLVSAGASPKINISVTCSPDMTVRNNVVTNSIQGQSIRNAYGNTRAIPSEYAGMFARSEYSGIKTAADVMAALAPQGRLLGLQREIGAINSMIDQAAGTRTPHPAPIYPLEILADRFAGNGAITNHTPDASPFGKAWRRVPGGSNAPQLSGSGTAYGPINPNVMGGWYVPSAEATGAYNIPLGNGLIIEMELMPVTILAHETACFLLGTPAADASFKGFLLRRNAANHIQLIKALGDGTAANYDILADQDLPLTQNTPVRISMDLNPVTNLATMLIGGVAVATAALDVSGLTASAAGFWMKSGAGANVFGQDMGVHVKDLRIRRKRP